MNILFSNDDIIWFRNIKLKENVRYNYEIEINFLNINKYLYFNILDRFKNLTFKIKNYYEYIKYDKNYIYFKKEYNNYEVYKIKKTIKYKYLENIPASIKLNSELILNRKINIDDKYKKFKKEKKSFMIKNLIFYFIIVNNKEYYIKINIKKLKNINDIKIIYFNNLRKIINHIPYDNYIIHKLHLYKIKSIMKQPIPLKNLNEIDNNFAVTQKFDGVRSLMFINECGNVFLIKNNLNILMKTNLNCKNLSNVVIDGELVNNEVFYAFDIIIFKKMEESNLKDRINILKNISFTNNNYNNNVYYKVKKYYFNNIFEYSKKLNKKTVYYLINKKRYEIKTDGLIFNSIYENYRKCKIYKWKPTITIDFKILKKQQNNSKYVIWNLYCYSYNNEFVLFPIEKYNKIFVNKETDKLYENNKIIEFAFNEKDDSFYPIRLRDDKIYPNFIDIAIDNWNCLTNISKIVF